MTALDPLAEAARAFRVELQRELRELPRSHFLNLTLSHMAQFDEWLAQDRADEHADAEAARERDDRARLHPWAQGMAA